MTGKADAPLANAEQAAQALSPEHKKYRQLAANIDKAKAELAAWQEQTRLFAEGFAERVLPLVKELSALHRELVLRLDAMLTAEGWTKTERKTMRRALCELAADLAASEFLSDAEADEMKALHDQHADIDLDTQEAQALADQKQMIELVTGVDLGEEAFESEEELARHAQERLQAQAQARADERDRGRPGRKSAAQRKREREEADSTQSVREVFRKLASALHPDRASDEDDRLRRTALMQRVNQAYEQQDLLALFALQLEIEQVDAEHLARASGERLRHYNRVLAAQLAEMQAQLHGLQHRFREQFELDHWGRIKPSQLGKQLEVERSHMRGAVLRIKRSLQLLNVPASARKWLKDLRMEQSMDDRDPFGLPF